MLQVKKTFGANSATVTKADKGNSVVVVTEKTLRK
jgi:predicted transcriptional regulator